MVVAIIIVLAWAAILGPSLMKRRSRLADGVHSISHFHHQLRVLEHSAPEPIVAPAYRLHTIDGAGRSPSGIHVPGADTPPVLSVVGAKELPRPALAFLGEPAPEPTRAPVAVPAGRPLRPGGPPDPGPRIADGHARRVAARRRRDTLAVLCGLVVVSFLVGFAPGASSAWIVTLLAGMATAVYVTLLVRLRQQAEERERKLRYLGPRIDWFDPLDGIDPADPEAPVGAIARGPANPARAMAERYGHPSTGRAVAH